MVSTLEQLEQKMKNNRVTKNMTSVLIDQFSELVKSHIGSTMLLLHKTNNRVGPTTCEGCLLSNFEFSYSLSFKFQVDNHLFNFEGKKDISLAYLACASLVRLAFL